MQSENLEKLLQEKFKTIMEYFNFILLDKTWTIYSAEMEIDTYLPSLVIQGISTILILYQILKIQLVSNLLIK